MRRNGDIPADNPNISYCPADRHDLRYRSNGEYVYLAGCAVGTGTVQLKRKSDGRLLNTYTFDIASSSADTRTPTPAPTPTATACIPAAPHTTDASVSTSSGSSGVGVTPTATPVPANFPQAVATAVAAWNPLVATSEPRLLFCTDDNALCQGSNSRNTDGYIITVKVVAGAEDEVDPEMANLGIYTHCGPSVACVEPTDPATYGDDDETIHNIFGADAPAHLENITVVIEDPAYEEPWQRGGSPTRIYWTNDITKVGISNPVNGEVWRYLPSTMMHEFGHTAGLLHPPERNIYSYPGLMGFPGDDREAIVFMKSALMDDYNGDQDTDSYFLGSLEINDNGSVRDGFSIASPHSKRWLPSTSAGGTGSATGDEQEFFLNAPGGWGITPPSRAASLEEAPTITLGKLKDRIIAVAANPLTEVTQAEMSIPTLIPTPIPTSEPTATEDTKDAATPTPYP